MARVTPSEAAKLIRVSLSIMYRWISSKQLPHYRLGAQGKRGRIMIETTDLDQFVEKQKVGPDEDELEPLIPRK